VTLAHHEGDAIKDASVRFSLLGKSCKRVLVALQFKPMQLAVNNREIDPRNTVLNA
jgi:hypothetical protein